MSKTLVSLLSTVGLGVCAAAAAAAADPAHLTKAQWGYGGYERSGSRDGWDRRDQRSYDRGYDGGYSGGWRYPSYGEGGYGYGGGYGRSYGYGYRGYGRGYGYSYRGYEGYGRGYGYGGGYGCGARHPSYDWGSQTYRGWDGLRHWCG